MVRTYRIITICKPKFIISMNCMRELPPDYLDLCPTIDEKYKVVFKLGSGRFSKYFFIKSELRWRLTW